MMSRYVSYLLRHKWFVFLECCKAGIPIRGILHDWSKFLLDEFVPYYYHFYVDIKTGRDNTGFYKPKDTGDMRFEIAWLLHSKRNDHHWQYWCMPDASGNVAYEMPLAARKEMVADWRAAGRAQGTPDTRAWYRKNYDKLILGPETRQWVEHELGFDKPEVRTDVGESTYDSY